MQVTQKITQRIARVQFASGPLDGNLSAVLSHDLASDLCDNKECTVQGQICVINDDSQAECKCRESCPRSFNATVCGSDGITYTSRCVLDMTSCKLSATSNRITMVSNGRCPGMLCFFDIPFLRTCMQNST